MSYNSTSPKGISIVYYLCFIVFLFITSTVSAQLSTSGQVRFVTPATLSACNNDTICIELTNLKGAKGVTYTGNTTIAIDIPGGSLIKYVNNSVSSVPAGATQVSYASNKLTLNVPLPATGSTTKICFVVVADCNVSTLSPLPKFSATVTYPSGFPIVSESLTSSSMNVGVGNLYVAPYNSYFGPTATYDGTGRAQGKYTYSVLFIGNTGYGDITNVKVTRTMPNILNGLNRLFTASNPGWDQPGAEGTILSTTNNGTYTTTEFSLTSTNGTSYGVMGANLGPDHKLAAGQSQDRLIQTDFTVPNQCGEWEITYKVEFMCADGSPSCQAPQYFTDKVISSGGTPKLDAVLNTFEKPDGCPDKHVKYTITNNGVGNAAPVGNAYDVDFNINLGGGYISIKNLKLNGIAVPNSAVTPSTLQAGNFKINIKDLNTTAYGGLTDIDGDGKLDDMLVGASVVVEFDYTMPCTEACGANLYNQLSAYNTFTDFCRTLTGVTSTPLGNFGFQQVQPLTQAKTDVNSGGAAITPNYGIWTAPADTKTKLAKFTFQYKEHNLDLLAATAKLVINYSAKMEVNPATIKINGVAPTNAPVQMGTASYTPVYGPGDPFTGGPTYMPYSYINGATDNDSAYVITLTAAELAAMFDATPDALEYESTYYGCGKRQNQNNGDNWQLLVTLKPGLCTDGSIPCSFDLACRKPYSYSAGSGCTGKPCFVSDLDMLRVNPVGGTDITLATTTSTPDLPRLFESDTLQIRNGTFITNQSYMEPAGTYYTGNKPYRDGNFVFTMKYTKPVGWNGNYSPFIFTPTGSSVKIRQYTPTAPGSTVKGTVGAVIFEAPLEIGDFFDISYNPATNQNTYALGTKNGNPVDNPAYYCGNPTYMNVVEYTGQFCSEGAQPYFWWGKAGNISRWRMMNMPDNKAADFYNLNVGRALARAGWTGNYGDANIYIEVLPRFIINPEFPWDNSNDFSLIGGRFVHGGNADNVDYYSPSSTYFSNCGFTSGTALAVTKEESLGNPNQVYNADCGLTVHNKINYKSFGGDYFQGGEVRVPYFVDKVEITIPSEYAITPGTTSLTTTGCSGVTGYTAITATGTTGLVTFTNAGSVPHTYSDFPRFDDCAGTGNIPSTVFDLQYTLAKVGTAAPTNYLLPIKIYTRDEFGNVIILTDTASIAEAKPELTLTPVNSPIQNTDGGSCQPAFFDFQIQNNTLFDAPNVYFAAEGTAGTVLVNITDHPDSTYVDPIVSYDVTPYATTNLFAKLGTVKAGDIRIVRVYANTSICTDNLKVYADFGCAYPSPLQPNMASTTLDQTTATYQAKAPLMLARSVSSAMNITNLCDEKDIEIEVRNANLPNIYKLKLGIKIPTEMTYITGTAQVKHPVSGTYTNITTITSPNADSLYLDLSNNAPFNTSCGLTGSDTLTLNDVRIKFRVGFESCPTTSSSEILVGVSGENYCGTKSSTQLVIPINYIGSSGSQNNYGLSTLNTPLKICAGANQTQHISDIIYIKNLGGYGTSSGASSGKDSVTFTIPADASKLSLTNFGVGSPFTSPVIGTDAQGSTTIRVLIPSGIAVGDSIALPITYDLTPKVAKICLADATPLVCYYGLFSSPVLLECAAKGISCGAVTKNLRGSGLSLRSFDCCYGSIGDYVWEDTNKDGQQGAVGAEPPIAGVKVYLLDGTTGAKIDSTTTDTNGKYLFDSLFTGTYKVQFVSPVGSYATVGNTGADVSDSDAGASGMTHVIGIQTFNTGTGLPREATDTLRNNPQIDAGFIVCAVPTFDVPTTQAGTCTGINLNADATISIANITGDKAAISTVGASTFNGSVYSGATAVSGGAITFSGLQHGGVYIIRVYNASDSCYKDVTVTVADRTCCPSPNCATVTVIKN